MTQNLIVTYLFIFSIIMVVLSILSICWNRYNKSTFIFFALALASALIATYLKSSYIDVNKLGDQEKFGQFGDFIGGVLNPIFGFITVLILIHTAKLQGNEQARNKKIRDIETLYRLLDKAKNAFEQSSRKETLIDANGKKFSFESTLRRPDSPLRENQREYTKTILDQVLEMKSILAISPILDHDEDKGLNLYEIFKLREEYKSVIKHYEKLLELEDSEYAKADIAEQLDLYLNEAIGYKLITVKEKIKLNEKIREHRVRN